MKTRAKKMAAMMNVQEEEEDAVAVFINSDGEELEWDPDSKWK